MKQLRLFNYVLILCVLVALLSTNMKGQNANSQIANLQFIPSPIVVEPFIGTKGVLVPIFFSKPLAPTSKLGFTTIAEYYGVYKTEEQPFKNLYMAQTYFSYELLKGLSFNAGGMITNITGFRPSVALQYSARFDDFSLLLAPRLDLSQTYNGEIMALLQYNPKINDTWGFYSHLQGLYNQDLQHNVHGISYLRARLGLSYQIFRFGMGANFNSYGPEKISDNEVGIFLMMLIF